MANTVLSTGVIIRDTDDFNANERGHQLLYDYERGADNSRENREAQ